MTTAPEITNPRVLLSDPAPLGAASTTRVLAVSWNVPTPHPDGDWFVEWDNMYPELSPDLSSARSEHGAYHLLQRESSSQSHTPEPPTIDEPSPSATPRASDQSFDAPLSTARLLEFENGPHLQDVAAEDLSEFFETRPVVQAPTQIATDSASATGRTEVCFLLAGETELPAEVRVYFTPTWTPSNSPPALVATVKREEWRRGEGLHKAWAEKRLADLIILEDVARELELEGQRGLGQGRVKVGVEGGGMDEEAVRRESFMVGEEQRWVRERFLTETPDRTVLEEPTRGLGMTGLKLQTGGEPEKGVVEESEDEREEDLFALPLSPRSPDMAVSPFSLFRDQKGPSKLRMVETSMDAVVTPTSKESTPVSGEGRQMLTPPREMGA